MKTNPNPNATFEVKTSLKTKDAIALAIDKVGPKMVLQIMLSQCLWNTLEKTQFPSSMLATGVDEEKAEVAASLYYLLKGHWKEVSDKGTKMLIRKAKKAQKETKHENT